jgi:hypothetical protein
MNPTWWVIFIALLAAGRPEPAASAERSWGVNARQHHQQHRMAQGWARGELTRGEMRGLQREAREIRQEERAFRSDGRFTGAERREVHRDLDRLSRDIHRERHDGERRFEPGGQHDRFVGHGPGRHFSSPHHDQRFSGFGFGHRSGPWSGHPGFARWWHERPHPGRHLGHFGMHPRHGWHGGAPATPAARYWDRRFDAIEHRQRARIVQGIRSGELTESEARRLFAEQRAIEAKERRYLADGVLTRRERLDLLEDLRDARRHLYNELHDEERRFD